MAAGRGAGEEIGTDQIEDRPALPRCQGRTSNSNSQVLIDVVREVGPDGDPVEQTAHGALLRVGRPGHLANKSRSGVKGFVAVGRRY
jgi:hypothetical protein